MARFHPPQRCVLVCGKVRKGGKTRSSLPGAWASAQRTV